MYSSFKYVCCYNELDVLALVSSTCKDLYKLKFDHELLNFICHSHNTYKKVKNMEELLEIIDEVLFTSVVSPRYRRLRWKVATKNRPMVAMGKSILIEDYDTALHIIHMEYSKDTLLEESINYLIAYTLVVDDGLDWMIKNNFIGSRDDVDADTALSYLLSFKPLGYEYTVLKYFDVTLLYPSEKGTRDLLDKFLINKDYDSFRKVVNICIYINDDEIAYSIVHSGNMEVYDNPSLLGLNEELTPTRELLESPHIIGCSQDLAFLEEYKELLQKGEDMFTSTDKNTQVLLWKLQFKEFREDIVDTLTQCSLSVRELDLTNNGETIQDYIDFIKKLSELFDMEELKIFSRVCYCFDPYDAREILRYYKSINEEISEDITDIITGTNLYEDREYYELLNN